MATTTFKPNDLKPLIKNAAFNMVIAVDKGDNPEAQDVKKITDILALCNEVSALSLITLTAEEYILIKRWSDKETK